LNDTIKREDSGSWITDGFTVGHAVWVDGAENEANNIIDGYVSSVTADTLTLIRPELLTEAMVGGTMTGSPSLTFAEQGATGDTITRGSGDWESDGFEPGMEITVTGTASNNITNAYIAEITSPTILTLGPTDLTAETSLTASVVGSCRVRGVPNFIQTANFNTPSAVEAGPVSGLTLDGNLVTTGPCGNITELQAVPVANGVFIDAQHAIISDNRIKGFRGYGAGVQTSNTTARWA
jgi:hypothetical protein